MVHHLPNTSAASKDCKVDLYLLPFCNIPACACASQQQLYPQHCHSPLILQYGWQAYTIAQHELDDGSQEADFNLSRGDGGLTRNLFNCCFHPWLCGPGSAASFLPSCLMTPSILLHSQKHNPYPQAVDFNLSRVMEVSSAAFPTAATNPLCVSCDPQTCVKQHGNHSQKWQSSTC